MRSHLNSGSICLICFLYNTTAKTALLFVSDLQEEVFSSAVRLSLCSPLFPGMAGSCSYAISPVCQRVAAGSWSCFTCAQREQWSLCCHLLTTLHPLLTALGWRGTALNTIKLITHRRVPAGPEAPGSLQATPLVSQTDCLRNVDYLVRNYKRFDGAFRSKRGVVSFLQVPGLRGQECIIRLFLKELKVSAFLGCPEHRPCSVPKHQEVSGLCPHSAHLADFHTTGAGKAPAFRKPFHEARAFTGYVSLIHMQLSIAKCMVPVCVYVYLVPPPW